MVVEPYLCPLGVYDPPNLAVGCGLPAEASVWDNHVDAPMIPEQGLSNMQVRVNAFYEHQNIALGEASGLTWTQPTGTDKTPTIDSFTAEERATYCDPAGAMSDMPT
ncbi:hypothetical protein FB45DRAFT_1036801 [Roridomyces roridus]|uniref:Uncharacterized protein n=1 Tax=Roridomyces roridus TaxID=1738132 RepID=A0AAD7B7M8_9AGAR|nr:hypothetical protein FB45DRAFT_1036801 [Roridomyces roridus]